MIDQEKFERLVPLAYPWARTQEDFVLKPVFQQSPKANLRVWAGNFFKKAQLVRRLTGDLAYDVL